MVEQAVSAERVQFDRDGFSIFRNVLEESLLDRLRAASDASLAEQDEQHFAEHVATGSMILVNGAFIERYPVFAEFIAHPAILQALARLGFHDPKFGHGRVISKPPHSPPLFWHEDGRFWDDPVSYTPVPIQAFLMCYLTDTTPENGCLRVIPGSHLKRHALHDLVPETHRDENRKYLFLMCYLTDTTPENGCLRVIPGSHLKRHALHDLVPETHRDENRKYLDPENNPAFAHYDDEMDVPLRAGDFVVGYGSLFHAAHANSSAARRTCLTMWYYPAFPELPERTRATVASVDGCRLSADAIPEIAALLRPLGISYAGDAEPIPTNWVCGLR